MARETRATKEQIAVRVEDVANLLVAGTKRRNIIQYGSEKGWNLEERQIDKYIQKARSFLAKEAAEYKEHHETEFAKAIRRLDTIFAKTMNVQDYARALTAQKEINSLLALYEPQKSIVEFKTWQDRAIEDIKAGLIIYRDLEQEFDSELATQLFARAGVRISLPETTG